MRPAVTFLFFFLLISSRSFAQTPANTTQNESGIFDVGVDWANLNHMVAVIRSEDRAEDRDPPTELVDVKAYGATGDGATDDTAAVQAAINSAGSGNTVFFPHGNYCINGGIVVTNPSVRLTGGSGTYGTGSNLLSCNNANVTLVSLQGAYDTIYALAIVGPSGTSITSPTVSVGSGAANFLITFSNISHGYYSLQLTASGGTVAFNNLTGAYGPAIVYATGSNHFIRNTIDQNFPISTPAVHSLANPLPFRLALRSYSVGSIAISGGWLLQCRIAGVSGGSDPVLSTYGTDIHDGSVVWRMVAPSTYYGMQLDQLVTATQITQGDFTGPYTAGIAMTNSVLGTKPLGVKISATNFGDTIPNSILASGGSGLYISGGNTFGDCLQVGCAFISFTGSWVGQSYIVGNTFAQGSIGVDDSAGQALTITSNRFQGIRSTAFHAAAGQSLFNFSNNDCSTATGGSAANAACVVVDAGPSNHYIITNNLVYGTANGIVDKGTGSNKTVTGNQ